MKKPAKHTSTPVPGCHCHECSGGACHEEHPGHFIGAADCRFFLHTGVGRFCISTIGDYHPGGDTYPTEIGWQRYYETYVFDKKRKESRWVEIDGSHYQTQKQATSGHAAMVAKYQALHDKGKGL